MPHRLLPGAPRPDRGPGFGRRGPAGTKAAPATVGYHRPGPPPSPAAPPQRARTPGRRPGHGTGGARATRPAERDGFQFPRLLPTRRTRGVLARPPRFRLAPAGRPVSQGALATVPRGGRASFLAQDFVPCPRIRPWPRTPFRQAQGPFGSRTRGNWAVPPRIPFTVRDRFDVFPGPSGRSRNPRRFRIRSPRFSGEPAPAPRGARRARG